jgi:hypothetical protein
MSLIAGLLIAMASTGTAFAPPTKLPRHAYGAPTSLLATPDTSNEDDPNSAAAATPPPLKLSVRAMKVELQRFGIDHRDLFERAELELRLAEVRTGTRRRPPPGTTAEEEEEEEVADRSRVGSTRFRRRDAATAPTGAGPDGSLVEAWWQRLELGVGRLVEIDEERPWEWAERRSPAEAAALGESDRTRRIRRTRDRPPQAPSAEADQAVEAVEAAEAAGGFKMAAFWARGNSDAEPAYPIHDPPLKLTPSPPPDPGPPARLSQSSPGGAASLAALLASRGLRAAAVGPRSVAAQAALRAGDVASRRALAYASSEAAAAAAAHAAPEAPANGDVRVPSDLRASPTPTSRSPPESAPGSAPGSAPPRRRAKAVSKGLAAAKAVPRASAAVSALEALLKAERWWALALPRPALEVELLRLLRGRPRLAALLLDAPHLADGAASASAVAAAAAADERAGVVAVVVAELSDAAARLDDAALAEVFTTPAR